jgi:hypothetical protein
MGLPFQITFSILPSGSTTTASRPASHRFGGRTIAINSDDQSPAEDHAGLSKVIADMRGKP